MSRIDIIKLKVERARKQLHLFESEIGTFIQSIAQHATHQVNREAGEQVWIFDSETPVTYPKWGLDIGEILYNFRSALDHLAWQLVLANGQTPGINNAFPIFMSPQQFQSKVKALLRGVRPSAQTTIERLQPYHGGYTALWRLHELCNIDKHRHLHTAVTVSASHQRMSGDSDSVNRANRAGVYVHFGPVERNTILFRISDPDVNVNFKPAFTIAFSDVQPRVSDLYVTQTLFGILLAVDEVVHRLTPELP